MQKRVRIKVPEHMDAQYIKRAIVTIRQRVRRFREKKVKFSLDDVRKWIGENWPTMTEEEIDFVQAIVAKREKLKTVANGKRKTTLNSGRDGDPETLLELAEQRRAYLGDKIDEMKEEIDYLESYIDALKLTEGID